MPAEPAKPKSEQPGERRVVTHQPPLPPLPNYSLSTECPACGAPTFRHACKVRCPRCDFAWDCSEL